MQGFETADQAIDNAKESKSNPFDKTILLSVTIKMLGTSRKVSSEAVECDTDKTLLRVSKKILNCDEYDKIQKAVAELKKMLRARTIPGVQFIKGGIYPIPTSRIDEVDGKLKDYIDVYNAAVARFVEVYEARKEESIAALKALGSNSDYPPVEAVRRSFGIATQYVTLGPPANLQSINKEIWDRENQKIKALCQDAAGQVQGAMRTMFADLVSHMVERLKPGEDGKKKIFKDTLVGNFKDFIGSFADRNITDDNELAALVQQAQNILAGKSVDALRKNDDVRGEVAAKMEEVKASLDAMLTDRPMRSITIVGDDDDDAPVTTADTGSDI